MKEVSVHDSVNLSKSFAGRENVNGDNFIDWIDSDINDPGFDQEIIEVLRYKFRREQ